MSHTLQNFNTCDSCSSKDNNMVNEGEGKQGTLDIEMKYNSLYGQLTAAPGTDNIVTKPIWNEVYRVSVLADMNQVNLKPMNM